jgi:5'-3' exonuclease
MSVAPLYLVDSSIYIFRAYFSLPERWHSPEGYPLNAVYGYASFLLDLCKALGERESHGLAATFDESLGSCYRNQIFPAYKSSRELPDEALAYQLKACRKVTELLGIPCFSGSRYEADDYIATLATQGRQRGHTVTVVSRDKDLGQLLVSDEDRLWDFAAGDQMDRHGFLEKFGVWPEQFADYLGLVGDSIDDIPGVPAVGAKTGAKLIHHFGSLESLAPRTDALDGLGIRGAARISKNLQENWQLALISRQMARLEHAIEEVEFPAPFQLHADAIGGLLAYMEALGLRGGLVNRARSLMLQMQQR